MGVATRKIPTAFALAIGLVACDWSGRADLPLDPGPQELKEPALAFAMAFLALVDAGEIAETWPLVARAVQQRSGRETWQATLRSTRAALGPMISRELSRHGFAEELADAPPGSYFVFDFESEFEQGAVVERVVCSLEGGTAWRAAGYFVTNVPRAEN
jgi:hypothetical protein